ncbi:hypothetical protein BDF19DRAFT_267132 [Syncephalis fuscata]|nr:hypothetical protein BDF19DRAFT_267132 [Syncephalis fuscata]
MLIAQRGQLQLLNLDLEEEEHIELSGETPITGVLGQIEALGGLYLALGHASGRVDILDPWGHRLYRTSLSASITSMALVKEQQDAIWVVGNRSGELIALDQGQIRWRIDTMDYLNTCRKTFPNSCVKSRHNGIIAMVSAWLPLNYASTDLQHQLIVSSSAFPDVLTSVLAGKIIWTAGTPARVNTVAVGYFDTSLGAISTCEQVVAGCEDGAIYLMDAMLSSNDVSFKQLAQLRQPIRQLVAMPLAFHSTESTMMIACVTLTNTLTLVRNGMVDILPANNGIV